MRAFDDALELVDEISPGLMPLVCLAGTLLPFADAAVDLLKRSCGVRVSASTVLRDTEGAPPARVTHDSRHGSRVRIIYLD